MTLNLATENSPASEPPNVSKLQGLLKELVDTKDLTCVSSLVDKALGILHQLPTTTGTDSSLSPILLNQLHGMGISLWNRAVTLKSAAAINLNINAQLRHVASTTVLLCNPFEECSSQVIKKYITMGLKTGRAWLESDNPEMAETSLHLAHQYWNKMVSKFPKEAESTDSQQLLFKIYCSQSEAALANLNEEKSMEVIRKAKNLLKALPQELIYLSSLCYNYGLQQFKCNKYSNAVSWLKESYEIGRSCSSGGTDVSVAVKQARTLRLLATSYLEWDSQIHWQKALNAIGLATSEHSHPAGLLLKARILLQFMPHGDDRATSAVQDILNHPDSSLDINIIAIRETYKHGRHQLAIELIRGLKPKTIVFSDRERLEQIHLELLLESNLIEEAKRQVESYIKAHTMPSSSDNDTTINNIQSSQHFHILLWEQASKAYECQDYDLALQWYQYSLVLLNKGASPPNQNTAKLQRNCCSCYLELRDYDKAEEIARDALTNDKDSVHTYFLLFKIAVHTGKEDKAIDALQKMTGCSNGSEDIPGLLGLGAQMAFEKNNHSLAIEALECIARNPLDTKHALTSLRCLLRLKLTLVNQDGCLNLTHLRSVLMYIRMAESHIGGLVDESEKTSEATWFMKTSWNTGLLATTAFREMAESFDLCRKFSSFLPNDQANYSRQRTCLLMASSALLQAARSTNQQSEKPKLMESVLAKTEQWQEVLSLCGPIPLSDPAPSLILLYQLEARLALGITGTSELLDKISSLPRLEPKLYETIAALIIQNPPREGGAQLAQNALRTAIKLHTESEHIDTERLSQCSHSLIQLLMGREGNSDMMGKEQAMVIFKTILSLMEEKGGFPEMEVVWHMVKGWNTGIHLYSVLKYRNAESWCSLAMKFLPLLSPDIAQSYRSQMSSVYEELLERISNLQSTDSQELPCL